jgi:hypothetical protein
MVSNDLVVDGKTVSPFHVQSATAPFEACTGMPALSMQFGTSHNGLPIGVQIVSSWLAESTVLKVASLLEEVSPVPTFTPPSNATGAGYSARRCPAISASIHKLHLQQPKKVDDDYNQSRRRTEGGARC